MTTLPPMLRLMPLNPMTTLPRPMPLNPMTLLLSPTPSRALLAAAASSASALPQEPQSF